MKLNSFNIFKKTDTDFNPPWAVVAAVSDAVHYGFNTPMSFPPFRIGGAQ